MKAARALWRNRDGSALFEASVLTPMLLSLVLGVYEFSWYFIDQQLVEAGVRDAARYMTRIPITSTTDSSPCDQTDSNGNFYTSYAQNIAVYGNAAGTGMARVGGWTPANVAVSCPSSPSGTYADGTTTMTIIYVTTTFNPTRADGTANGLFGILGLTAPSLSSIHQERFMGPG